MPQLDIYHNVVRTALEKDGWQVTKDPMYIAWEGAVYFPDLAAEKVIAAIRGTHKIAVEIKTFTGQVFQEEFYKTLGQLDNYYYALEDIEPDRELILAIPTEAYENYFQKPYVKKIITKKRITVLVYNEISETIEQWIR